MSIDLCKKHLCHFNPHYITVETNLIEIEETQQGGEGTARFGVTKPSLRIKGKKHGPLLWALRDGSCADGAFITFDDEGPHLHIVELKSKMTSGTWEKAELQFSGMFFTASALLHLMRAGEFASATCYVAISEDAISTQLVSLKVPTGGTKTAGNVDGWIKEKVDLPFGVVAKLRKATKDADKVADFGQVA